MVNIVFVYYLIYLFICYLLNIYWVRFCCRVGCIMIRFELNFLVFWRIIFFVEFVVDRLFLVVFIV